MLIGVGRFQTLHAGGSQRAGKLAALVGLGSTMSTRAGLEPAEGRRHGEWSAAATSAGIGMTQRPVYPETAKAHA